MKPKGTISVTQASAELHRGPAGIRKLIHSGKLKAVKQGGKYHVTRDSLERFISQLPHPPKYFSLLDFAQQTIGRIHKMQFNDQGLAVAAGTSAVVRDAMLSDDHVSEFGYPRPECNAGETVQNSDEFVVMLPYLQALKTAVREKQYEQAEYIAANMPRRGTPRANGVN